jgi:hypothetical protein
VFSELGCALLVVLGIQIRTAAVPLIITMAVAAFQVQRSEGFVAMESGLLYGVAFGALAWLGSGRFSIEHALRCFPLAFLRRSTGPGAGAPSLPRRKGKSRFYPTMAIAMTVIVLVGFSATYFVPLANGRLQISRLVHVHAALFLSWLILYLAQTLLVGARRPKVHMRLGILGAALASVMPISGVYVALAATARHIAAGHGEQAKAFLIVPLTDMLVFSVLVSCGLALRKRPEAHKRLMLLVTGSLLPPALGRAFAPLGVSSTMPSTFAADGVVLACILHDLWTTRRVHPASLWGGGYVLGVHLLRELLGATSGWMSIAEVLAHVAA